MNGSLNIAPKVAGGTLAGAAAILIIWILSLVGIAVPDVAAAALATTLSGFGGWLAPAGYAQQVALALSGRTLATAITEPPAEPTA